MRSSAGDESSPLQVLPNVLPYFATRSGALEIDIVGRVDGAAVIVDGEVQVGTGGHTGGAHIADDLACLDLLALGYLQILQHM